MNEEKKIKTDIEMPIDPSARRMENFHDLPEIVDSYEKGGFGDAFSPDGPGIMPRIQFFHNHIINRTPQSRILLDVGCATANLGGILASERSDLQYIGFDLSFPMLKRARERHSPTMNLVNGDIQNLPFKLNSVQYAICAGTLFYCNDPAAIVESLYRIASRGIMIEILFLAHEEVGTTTNQYHDGIKTTAYILGKLELDQLIVRLGNIQPFKNLTENGRCIIIALSNKGGGLFDLGDRTVFSFCGVFEKRPRAFNLNI